jgi:endonuclease III
VNDVLTKLHGGSSQGHQGRNFKSCLIQEVLQCLGMSKTCTTPLHLQSDCMLEHHIKKVEEHLKKVIAPQGLGRKIAYLPSGLQGIHS